MTTNNGPAALFRNDQLAGNRSLRFHLVGTKSNRDAIGATVRIFHDGTSQSRLVKSGSSYLSQSELPVTFGVGKRDRVDARRHCVAERADRGIQGRRVRPVVRVRGGQGDHRSVSFMKALAAIAASTVLATLLAGGLYLAGVKHFHWTVIRPLLSAGFVRAYLSDSRFRQLIDVMNDEEAERTDAFAVLWGAGKTELISKRIFRSVEMYGVTRYMYKPDVRTLQFVAGAAGLYRAVEMEDTPALRRALSGLDTTRLAEASYDRLGFRRVDAELTRDCSTRVLFLGDSFTDGVGVNDGETFVSRYGHLVRERLRLPVCPDQCGRRRLRLSRGIVRARDVFRRVRTPAAHRRDALR